MAKRGRPKKTIEETKSSPNNYLDKITSEVQNNQSKLSMVLGGLIILVIGILVFNYFSKSKNDLGPAQNATLEQADVTADNLPGKYTVKDGDTLFIIAEKYYNDGSKYSEIVKANNLTDENSIITGQVLEIPKLEQQASPTPSETPIASPSETPSESPKESPTPISSPTTSQPQQDSESMGTGGANTTIWGTRIEGNTYTVLEGDWLSKIAGRAYGDVFAYQKIAQANNITDPDYIVPGMVLTIPR